jgi:hypothetical protein
MLFVYADTKSRYIAYPRDHLPQDYKERNLRLVRDLERISNLCGEFSLTKDAKSWGTEWYEHFHRVESKQLDGTLLGGYIARKQTLVHKIAMCLSASQGDSLLIDRNTLERAVALITELEAQMPMVYSKIGMTKEGAAGEQIMEFVKKYGGSVDFNLLYRYMHKLFPNVEMFENILTGLCEANYLRINKSLRTVELVNAE